MLNFQPDYLTSIKLRTTLMNANHHQQWVWKETEQGSYLTCKLLANWQHGFFTNHFPQQSPPHLIKHLHPQASIYRLKQVHSAIVLETDYIDQNQNPCSDPNLLEGDGILTNQSQQSAWSASADCTPVLIADRHSGKVAAIHSGWRGTASKIIPNAIALFLARGSKLNDLLFALGPAINGEVYQVEQDVAFKVINTIIPHSDHLTTDELLSQALALPNQVLLKDTEQDKWRLDVTQTIHLQIQQQGISPENIAIAPYCTYQTPEHFFSYRRSRQKKNQWSGIVSA